MYVADSPDNLMKGIGQLYVFRAADNATYNTWDDIYYSSGDIEGKFVPVSWDYKTQNETQLHSAAVAAGAFEFVRPEDAAMDKRPGHTNVMYMADTGNDKDEDGNAIPAGSNGQLFKNGRIYKFAFTDPQDVTSASFRVILDGDDSSAPGYNTLMNPDNLDTSSKSLMINEDHNGYNRFTVSESPYNVTKNAKILRYNLETSSLETVAYVNQLENATFKHGDWESSGILNVSEYFGEGKWLTTVQAHGMQEGGQLLLLSVDGS